MAKIGQISALAKVTKGSSLAVANVLLSAGTMLVLVDGKELIGATLLVLGGALYLVREFFLKK